MNPSVSNTQPLEGLLTDDAYGSLSYLPDGNQPRLSAIYIVDSHVEEYERVATGVDSRRVRVQMFPTAGAVLRVPRYQMPLFYVVNVQLADMSGFDLREMLADRWPHTPGYLISDAYDAKEEIKARCCGATLYFCKPLKEGWLAAATRATDVRPPSKRLAAYSKGE